MESLFTQITSTSNNAGVPVLFALTDTGDIYQRNGTGPWILVAPPDGVNTENVKEQRQRSLRRFNGR